MKKIVPILVLVALVTTSLITSRDWLEESKAKARRAGQRMGLVKETPLEKMKRGAQQMGEGIVAGWEEFTEQLPGQVDQFKEDVTIWGQDVATKTKKKAQQAQDYLKEQWKKAPWSKQAN